MPIPQAPMDAGVKAPPANQPVPPTGGIQPPSTPNTNPIPETPGLAPAAPAAGSPPPMTPPAPVAPASATVPPVAPTSPAPTPGLAGVGVSAIPQGGSLRGSSVLPTSDVDRQALAQSRFDTSAKASAPAYEAAIRSATQHAAANGAVGSGELGTTYGNLALQRTRDLDTQRATLNADALEGSIGDARSNRAEVRGERGYENGLEGQAYDRGVQGLTLEDALTNSQFGRSQGQFSAGNTNNPAPYQLGLSEMYGKNAQNAGSSLGEYTKAKSTNDAMRGVNPSSILSALGIGGGDGSTGGSGDMNPGLGIPSISDIVGGYLKKSQPQFGDVSNGGF